ncbi:lytic murein transglycosylase B [Algiphilus sp.]|uniref:lytic murein transglycosylase B n=1 Tax=Algiphilus sp. TaxID=1872431 RepID=UPI003B516B99
MMRRFAFLLLIPLAFGYTPPAAANYADHPRAQALLDTLRADYGFDTEALDAVRQSLAEARRLPELIQQERNAPERTRTWTEYRAMHISEAMIDKGVRFLREHAETLARAQAQYGVPPEVIVAILGIETRYGGYTGRTRVLDALATQGFDHPSRTPFFFSELTAFFVLAHESGMDPTKPKGSYAGAMGWAQFMPSNIRRLAVDFNDDGTVDLWTPEDAIGSIARYLIDYDPASAWRPDEAMTLAPRRFEVRADAITFNPKRPNSTIAALARLGAEPTRSAPPEQPAGLLELERSEGRSFLIALPNFFSVMRYNPRTYYAMAVGELAEGISRATGHPPGRYMP